MLVKVLLVGEFPASSGTISCQQCQTQGPYWLSFVLLPQLMAGSGGLWQILLGVESFTAKKNESRVAPAITIAAGRYST
jgi:hypothetical protein